MAKYARLGAHWSMSGSSCSLLCHSCLSPCVFILPDAASDQRLKGLAARLIATVGFIVTLGLLVYEVRNSQLHNDLVSRGRRIEAELGIHTGIFRGRPNPKYLFLNHGTAIFLVYAAALAGWVIAFILAA